MPPTTLKPRANQRLLTAAAALDLDAVEQALQAGASPDAAEAPVENLQRDSALNLAIASVPVPSGLPASSGTREVLRAAVVDRLIHAGASVSRRSMAHGLPVLQAALNGQWPIVMRLLSAGASVHSTAGMGTVNLGTLAVQQGCWDALARLVDHGLNPRRRTRSHATLLHTLAEHLPLDAEPTGPVQRLLDWGVPLRAQNEQRQTALGVAIQHGHLGLAQHLYGRRMPMPHHFVGSMGATDAPGLGPLHMASSAAMVRWLVDQGQSPNGSSPEGVLPLHRAASRGDDALTVWAALLDAGADPERSTTSLLGTPLELARTLGATRLVALAEQRALRRTMNEEPCPTAGESHRPRL